MRIIWALAGLFVLAYGGYCAALYFRQGALVFPGKETDQAQVEQFRRYYKSFEDVTVTVPGATLRGYALWRAPGKGPEKALIYYGGNAEEAGAFFLWSPQALPGWSIVSVDYRGYGASDGTSTEELAVKDALAVYDAVRERLGPAARIAVMGRSLGSGIALRVAAGRDAAALVLVTPYDSLANVGADNYPFVPVKLLMRQRFDVTEDAPRVTAPTLFIVADKDSLVRPERAEVLAALWKGEKEYRVLPGGHNGVIEGELYWPTISGFLNREVR